MQTSLVFILRARKSWNWVLAANRIESPEYIFTERDRHRGFHLNVIHVGGLLDETGHHRTFGGDGIERTSFAYLYDHTLSSFVDCARQR